MTSPGLVQQGVDGGDVAVPAEHLGVADSRPGVEVREHPLGAVPAPDAEDALDAAVQKGVGEVLGTLAVLPRQVAMGGGGAGVQHRLQAQGLYGVHSGLHPLRGDGTTGAHQGHPVARR